MFIKNLKLLNYRNYDALNIEFSNNFNIIYGDNGQGKTNILESIYICASGRSHRTSKDADIIKVNEKGYYVKVNLQKQSQQSSIEIAYDREEKKRIRINEIPVKRIGNLMGHLNAVMFSPEDLLIIKEGPQERRRFIDIAISQLKPTYFYDLQQYSKILTQRNNLLKNIQYKRSLIDTLDVWDNNLITIGARLIKARMNFTTKLSKYVEGNHYKLTGEKEKLIFSYCPSVKIRSNDDLRDIEKVFLKSIESVREREINKGSTLYGPQRDDYELYLNEMNLKLFGSQGQQRTAILSIKLSEIDIMKQETGEYPVLLLDDVMSELDAKRQDYLLNNLSNVQTFITCTEKNFFKERDFVDYKFFNVVQGEVNIG